MKPKVFVSKRVYPEAIELLRAHAEVDYHDSEISCPPGEFLARMRGRRGVISQLTDRLSADVLAQLPDLKVIANVAVGFDNIDVAAAAERGIVVANTPDVLTETTADFAFTLLMAAARRVAQADRFLRGGGWNQWYIDLLCGQDIHHATLGVLGMGRIGRAVARRARGFEMKVLYHDAQRAPSEVEQELGLAYVDQETLLRESDFVTIHVPLLPSTKGLINKPRLAMMKKTAVLINTSRGPVVDEAALAEALKSGEIAAAGLDVFESEPTVHPGLLELDNVVLTPHIASASVATRAKMCVMAAENMAAGLQGRRPPNIVSAEVSAGGAAEPSANG